MIQRLRAEIENVKKQVGTTLPLLKCRPRVLYGAQADRVLGHKTLNLSSGNLALYTCHISSVLADVTCHFSTQISLLFFTVFDHLYLISMMGALVGSSWNEGNSSELGEVVRRIQIEF